MISDLDRQKCKDLAKAYMRQLLDGELGEDGRSCEQDQAFKDSFPGEFPYEGERGEELMEELERQMSLLSNKLNETIDTF